MVKSLALCLTLFLSASGCTQPPSTPANTIVFGTDEGSWISLDVAPNGELLVFELLGDLYELPIKGGDAKPIISGRGFASQPRFSPDGEQLVFVSDRSGEDNLWLTNTDGSKLKQLSKLSDGELISPAWSRDGQIIYVSKLASRRSMTSNVEIWAYPVDGGEPKIINTPNMGTSAPLVSTFAPGAYGPQPSSNNSELFFTAAAPRQSEPKANPHTEIMRVNLYSGRTDTISNLSVPAFKPPDLQQQQCRHHHDRVLLGEQSKQ